MDEALFRTPPAEYRPVAMWFLNGDLEDAELRRQLGEMAKCGIGGVQVAARTGLEAPYMSERWFDVVRLVLDESSRNGMSVWLADEHPYPSGTSGGEVILRHPEFRAWQMRATHIVAAAGGRVREEAPGTVLLRAVAVPQDARGPARWADAQILDHHVGLRQREQVLVQPSSVYLTRQRYMSNAPRPTLDWRAPSGAERWEVWLIAAAEITDYKFFGGYVDLCNADACRLFLETTYQRYLDRLGPTDFARLAGFFLDESHPQNWSWCLPDAFRKRNGYDLLEVLPALWAQTGPDIGRIRYDYWQTITELFVNSFHKPTAEWCARHNVQLSLEVPSTRNIVQRYADVPGIDPGHDKVGTPLDHVLARELASYRGNLTFPASLAAQTGRRRVLDELFHSVGWSLTLQDMKAMLDRAAARGANLFALHAFCYTIGGLRKWDAPPSEFEQNPYWRHFSLVSTYAGRLAYAMSRGKRVARLAVLDPVSTLWTHQDAAGERDQLGCRVVAEWTAILRELTAAQRPHDTIDPLMLVEADVSQGAVNVGEAAYEVIVLPPILSVEGAVWRKLEEFVAHGGRVIACGDLPREEIELDGGIVARCETAFARHEPGFIRVTSPRDLLTVLDEVLPADVRLTRSAPDVLLAHRRDGDEDVLLVANSSPSELSCELRIRRPDETGVVRFDLESGDVELLRETRDVETGELVVQLEFDAYGCQLLSIGGTLTPAPVEQSPAEIDLELDGPWGCELASDNILRLDHFEFTTRSTWDNAVVIHPKPLINILQDLSGTDQTWPGHLKVPPIFGALPRIQLELPAVASYRTRFEVKDIPSRALMCIEDASLSGDWEMSLNGTHISRSQFVRKRRWDIGNREIDVEHLLQFGMNVLEVKVQVAESWDGLVDAVHLLGDFGVFFADNGSPVLGEAPETLQWRHRHTQGCPYYAGIFRLSRTLSLPRGHAVQLRIRDTELMFAGLAELSVNGQSLGLRAWVPFAWALPAGIANGDDQVTLSITNTLLECLEGRRYDSATRQVVELHQLF